MTESLPVPQSDSDPNERFVLEIVLRTDVGLVRSENQDYGVLSAPGALHSSGDRLMMVADGMGGHRGGATASRLAATTVQSELLAAAGGDIGAALGDAFRKANARIFEEAQADPDLQGMGTTGSALIIHGDKAHFAHVGDSRIYMVRDGEIRQLTEDHSVVASLVREGLLSRSEAEVHPRRNVLQRSIGVSSDVEVDVSDPIEVRAGDTFLICSDGLHGVVKEEEMKEVAMLPPEEAANEFVRRALERGAPDNVTIIVARVLARTVTGAARTTPVGEARTAGAEKKPRADKKPEADKGPDARPENLAYPEEPVVDPGIASGRSRSTIPTVLLWLFILLVVGGVVVYYLAVAPVTSSTTETTS
jgi:serine/threonine protein phosphatase PrpC